MYSIHSVITPTTTLICRAPIHLGLLQVSMNSRLNHTISYNVLKILFYFQFVFFVVVVFVCNLFFILLNLLFSPTNTSENFVCHGNCCYQWIRGATLGGKWMGSLAWELCVCKQLFFYILYEYVFFVLIHDWENIWQMYFFGFYSFAFYLMLLIDFFNFNRFFFVIEFFS